MAVKAVLFDLDGTLVDSEILWVEAYTKLIESLGFRIDAELFITQVHGKSFKDLYLFTKSQYPSFDLGINEMEDQMRGFFLTLRKTKDIIIHSSVKKLKSLAADYFIAIVSGSTRSDIFSAMEFMGISELIKCVVGAEDCTKGKPDPEGYLKAMSYGQFSPKECLVFEDSSAGIKAAKAAGMHCVALTICNHFDTDLSLADEVVSDLNLVDVSRF